MYWTLVNKTTNKFEKEFFHTFDDLLISIDYDLRSGFYEVFTKGNRKRIKEKLKYSKNLYENLDVYHRNTGIEAIQMNVWTYAKVKLKEMYIGTKYDSGVVVFLERLVNRFAGVFDEKFIVQVKNDIDLSSLGLIYTSARVYDRNFENNTIILTSDQFNYLRLVYPDDAVRRVLDVKNFLKDLEELDLIGN